MTTLLHGLALQFFRGIGPEKQRIGPFEKLNFFIGPNNAGKSTVIDFIHSYIPFPNGQLEPRAGHPDEYRGAITGKLYFEVGYPVVGIEGNASIPKSDKLDEESMRRNLSAVIEESSENEMLWVSPQIGRNDYVKYPTCDLDKIESKFSEQDWKAWTNAVSGHCAEFKRDFLNTWKKHMEKCLNTPQQKPVLIPAKRFIGPKDQGFKDFSGSGLINELVKYQNPKHDEDQHREVFRKFNVFVATVLQRESAYIEIPHDREHIAVHMDNKVLPLSSLGTGIHEVILIAAACTISSGRIICLEEPETHLHPLLQRRLIDYLRDETDNQYFVATHSATFIDTPDAAVFQVSNDGVQTSVRPALVKSDKRQICSDLGFKASDILQTNAIIWVEGPSDRIYLNHWLSAADPKLLEGLHYTVMFYGGRLLSHLSADDYQVGGFIDLLSINKNAAILIDSDRAKSDDRINETKLRICKEFGEAEGFCWVTQGREIENYIDSSVLQKEVRKSHPMVYSRPHKTGPYDHALEFVRKKAKNASNDIIEKDVDKVGVANGVAGVEGGRPNLDILDLRKQVTALARFLAAANGLP